MLKASGVSLPIPAPPLPLDVVNHLRGRVELKHQIEDCLEETWEMTQSN
jgi:hypothetical protein